MSDANLAQNSSLETQPLNISGNTTLLAGPDDYYALLKPRVMSLVIFTAFIGMIVAPAGINPFIGAVALLSIAVGAGASGALNMWWDADIDRIMTRTANRPIPAGKVSPPEAATFGIFLSVMSVTLLWLATNIVAAALLAFTIFFYVVIYSMWLKRATPQNIVIGGAAGALPPVVGWAAMTGNVPLQAWVLFAIIFIWTPPHFWALALYKEGDYERAGIPMMPNIAGERSTRKQIFAYSLLLAPLGTLPFFLNMASSVYLLVSGGLGIGFIALASKVMRAKNGDYSSAKKLFGFSILYLFLLFGAMGIDASLSTVLRVYGG